MKRSVVQLDKSNGRLIEEYENVEMAAAITGENVEDILSCCNGDLIGEGNYIWVDVMEYTMSNYGFESDN